MKIFKSFASDNNSGTHPAALKAIEAVNIGTASAYGQDPWTEAAAEALKKEFGPKSRPWFVFLGTAANVLGLACMLRPHQSILCAETAHINQDECGAPERITGSKLVTLPSYHGKVCLEDCRKALDARESVHHPYPRVLSITQTTECGTLYTLEELRAIGTFCRENGLYLHMDGARLANAAARLGASLKEVTADAGVDVVSFGGTKNGLLFGEAIVFLNDELGHDFSYVRKQHMQLGSKMRYVAAQFIEYLKDELWRKNALAANRATDLLAEKLSGMSHVTIEHPVESNAVFARLHKDAVAELSKEFYFYTTDTYGADGKPSDRHLVRLMTSFNTTDEEVSEFAEAIRSMSRFG